LNARSMDSVERMYSNQSQEVCQGEEKAEVKEIRVLSDHIPGRTMGNGPEPAKYCRSISPSGKITSSAVCHSPNFLLRYRNVE
jgi:hypothetical protein